MTLKYGQSCLNILYSGYKEKCKTRNIVFNLSIDEFKILTSSNCFYCNREPSQVVKRPKNLRGEYIYNGIDRVNPKKGYFVDNCVPCCKICNTAKLSMPLDEFCVWLIKTSENIKQRIINGSIILDSSSVPDLYIGQMDEI